MELPNAPTAPPAWNLLRVAYALGYAFLAWAATLAALQTWLGADPRDPFARVPATAVAFLFGLHVWGAAHKFGRQVETLVMFSFRFPVSLALATLASYLIAHFVSLAFAWALFGGRNGLPPAFELIMFAIIALFAVGYFEALAFHSDIIWFVLPDGTIRAASSATRWWRVHVPSPREFAERFSRLVDEQRRGVQRRSDDSPVRTAAEARRRAEGLN